ncbi:MAG: class I fructose-bisphosphate aldolase [Deltaproteobacteria bacterium]|nr:class I fructose-bisphosphate aldolase [Deltaproteobacteria bacterium]
MSDLKRIEEILGGEARGLLDFQSKTISRDMLHLPGSDFVDRVFAQSDRKPAVLGNLQRMYDTGRLRGTGYLSILPVDQGIEHSAAASFAPNPTMFDPEGICRLAIEGGCNAVASTYGVLGFMARKYAHKIPFIVKINHSELFSYPNTYDQVLFGNIKQCFEMGAIGVGATVYWGAPESRRQLQEVSAAFAAAHELGMFTVLWCYVRSNAFKTELGDHSLSADFTGQANHLGVTIQADIIKQKLPEMNGGYNDPKLKGFGKTHKKVYTDLTSPNPIDLTRYQVANCYMGRAGLINSGGASGDNDLQDAVKTAVINKRAGGMGLISGRKAFQKPMKEGVAILNAIQDVYACKDITVA